MTGYAIAIGVGVLIVIGYIILLSLIKTDEKDDTPVSSDDI